MVKFATVASLFALTAVAPAVGKSGMTANLLGHPSLAASPGTQVRIAWKLSPATAQAAHGDDDRFYVRLLSATGGRSTHAYGKFRSRRYMATVRIPRGGVSDIEIRLKGWVFMPGQPAKRADALIPIANDPFP
jgi:hypothetical protein